MAIVRDSECVAARILTTLNISLTKIYQDIFEAAGIDPAEFQRKPEVEEEDSQGCWSNTAQI